MFKFQESSFYRTSKINLHLYRYLKHGLVGNGTKLRAWTCGAAWPTSTSWKVWTKEFESEDFVRPGRVDLHEICGHLPVRLYSYYPPISVIDLLVGCSSFVSVCPNITFSVTILQLKPIYRQVNSYENLRNQE